MEKKDRGCSNKKNQERKKSCTSLTPTMKEGSNKIKGSSIGKTQEEAEIYEGMIKMGKDASCRKKVLITVTSYNKYIQILQQTLRHASKSCSKHFCKKCDTLFILGESIGELHHGELLTGNAIDEHLSSLICVHKHPSSIMTILPGIVICKGKFESFPIQHVLWCSEGEVYDAKSKVKAYILENSNRLQTVIKRVSQDNKFEWKADMDISQFNLKPTRSDNPWKFEKDDPKLNALYAACNTGGEAFLLKKSDSPLKLLQSHKKLLAEAISIGKKAIRILNFTQNLLAKIYQTMISINQNPQNLSP